MAARRALSLPILLCHGRGKKQTNKVVESSRATQKMNYTACY
jgi:hypothetical protein